MKTENDILRELLHCYQNIIPTDQRSEKIQTLEWVLDGENHPKTLDDIITKLATPNFSSTLLTTTQPDTTNQHLAISNIDDNCDDDCDGCDECLEFPDCLNKWERPFYGLMHEHPELKPKEIAEIMDCSLMTAHKHYKNIRAKLNIGG